MEEVKKHIREAIELYVGTLRPAEMKRLLKKRVYTTSMSDPLAKQLDMCGNTRMVFAVPFRKIITPENN